MIKQLITDLAYDRITLTQALSRAKILAYKIKNQEFQLWLKRELEGYDINNDSLPSYRKIPCTIKATVSDYWGYNEQTTTLAFTAASDDLKEIMNFVLETKSISAIEESYKIIDTETAIQYFKPEQLKSLEETFKFKEKFDRLIIRAGREFNKQYLKIIIDHTKQKLLDTLLELDEEFPTLEDEFVLNKETTEKVKNIITNNIYGNNNPLNVGAGVNIQQKDYLNISTSINYKQLEELGVEQKQIEELKSIVNHNSNDKPAFAGKLMKWLGSVSASVAAKGFYDNIPAISDFIHKLL